MKVPENFKVASNYDLQDPNGKVNPGVKFYVWAYHAEEMSEKFPAKYPTPEDVPLEEHVTTKDTNLDKWKEWMEDGRIFIEMKVFKPTSTLSYI